MSTLYTTDRVGLAQLASEHADIEPSKWPLMPTRPTPYAYQDSPGQWQEGAAKALLVQSRDTGRLFPDMIEWIRDDGCGPYAFLLRAPTDIVEIIIVCTAGKPMSTAHSLGVLYGDVPDDDALLREAGVVVRTQRFYYERLMALPLHRDTDMLPDSIEGDAAYVSLWDGTDYRTIHHYLTRCGSLAFLAHDGDDSDPTLQEEWTREHTGCRLDVGVTCTLTAKVLHLRRYAYWSSVPLMRPIVMGLLSRCAPYTRDEVIAIAYAFIVPSNAISFDATRWLTHMKPDGMTQIATLGAPAADLTALGELTQMVRGNPSFIRRSGGTGLALGHQLYRALHKRASRYSDEARLALLDLRSAVLS